MSPARIAVVTSAISSALVFALAATVYPGGNHFDHHAIGHDFWRNALCDVARSTAIGGAPNGLGAALARIAMSMLALGLGLHLWSLPAQFAARARLAGAVRALTAVTVPAALAVVFLPTDRFSDIHGVAVVLAGVLGTVAATIALVGLVLEGHAARPATVLGITTLVVSLGGLGVYASELALGGPPRPAVPVLEHFAALLLLCWMLSAALRRYETLPGTP